MMQSYDEMIEALQRENEIARTSDAQKDANNYLIQLYKHFRKKRTSPLDEAPYKNLSMEIMLARLADPNYRFTVQGLLADDK